MYVDYYIIDSSYVERFLSKSFNMRFAPTSYLLKVLELQPACGLETNWSAQQPLDTRSTTHSQITSSSKCPQRHVIATNHTLVTCWGLDSRDFSRVWVRVCVFWQAQAFISTHSTSCIADPTITYSTKHNMAYQSSAGETVVLRLRVLTDSKIGIGIAHFYWK